MKHLDFKRLLGLTALATLMAQGAMAQKIDFDFSGKSGSDRHTEAGFSNWAIGRVKADTIPNASFPSNGVALPEGMRITVDYDGTAGEGYFCGVTSAWAKPAVESNTLSKLTGDAVCSTLLDESNNWADPTEFSNLRFTVSGLSKGAHTLLALHNCPDKGHGQPAMVKVLVNGTQAADSVQQTIYADVPQSMDDVAQTFVTFNAVEGQDVVIEYVAVPADGVEYTNHRVYVNAFIFDAVDPNMKVTNQSPLNGNLHVDATDGSVTLTWAGSPSAASHRVMFGTSEDALAEVQNTTAESYTATGLTPLNTYFWRVDEVPAAGDPVEGDVFSFRINQLAFPGAEGFGRYAFGGRGGQVVHVTSLEDDGSEGTLRWALETVTGPRTVVFDVSGIINITKRIQASDYVTIAGQTAPGDGIMIRGQQISLGSEGITRFLRLRLGSVTNPDKGTGYSCIDLQGKNNSIADHLSVEWATAESFKAAGNYTADITVQNTIIAEALTNGGDYEEGFGYGFEAGGESGSFHHNLMSSNYANNPRISGGQDGAQHWLGNEEFYNNVAYNWQGSAANGAASKVNFAGNYYKAGPATSAEVSNLLSINVPKSGTGTMEYYVNGNVLDKNGTLLDNPYSVSLVKDDDGNPVEDGYEPSVQTETKVIDNGAAYETAQAAYARVLSEAGASLKRDATDKRIISEVANGTVSMSEDGMVSEVEDSNYDVYENVTRPADFDANQNGIADWFEELTGRKEANEDPDGDGYTNLEDYLNFMAEPNAVIATGETATFDLNDYFAGISGATYSVSGSGTVSGNTLSVTATAADQGILHATVTAAKGDISLSRTFNVAISGTHLGIHGTRQTTAQVAHYVLYDQAGRQVSQGQGNGAAVDRLNLRGVPAGVYILKVTDTEGQQRSFSVLKK